MALHPLPPQPRDVAWPTEVWPTSAPDDDVDRERLAAALAHGFADPPAPGVSHALLAVHRGRLVAERYDGRTAPDTPLPSWSMAKSVLCALVGILVGRGRLKLQEPLGHPCWPPDDARAAITIEHLLRMSSGLRFDGETSDPDASATFQMLFGAGQQDMAAFAARLPLDHPPGRVWSYSSGTSNLLAWRVGQEVGGGESGMRRFMREALFERIGMRSAQPRFDGAGTWIGSSFLFATARDFARFGLLCLRDGVWQGERILPEGWIDAARTATAGSAGEYGAHFWLATNGTGTFCASGFRGQHTVMVPERDLVLVRLGASMPEQKRSTLLWLDDIVRSFPLEE